MKNREESIRRACYHRLFKDYDNEKNNWATRVKHLLQEHGFELVWLDQGVDDSSNFIVEFEQRLKDCFIQKWHQEKEESSKLRYYNMFKK